MLLALPIGKEKGGELLKLHSHVDEMKSMWITFYQHAHVLQHEALAFL